MVLLGLNWYYFRFKAQRTRKEKRFPNSQINFRRSKPVSKTVKTHTRAYFRGLGRNAPIMSTNTEWYRQKFQQCGCYTKFNEESKKTYYLKFGSTDRILNLKNWPISAVRTFSFCLNSATFVLSTFRGDLCYYGEQKFYKIFLKPDGMGVQTVLKVRYLVEN